MALLTKRRTTEGFDDLGVDAISETKPQHGRTETFDPSRAKPEIRLNMQDHRRSLHSCPPTVPTR